MLPALELQELPEGQRTRAHPGVSASGEPLGQEGPKEVQTRPDLLCSLLLADGFNGAPSGGPGRLCPLPGLGSPKGYEGHPKGAAFLQHGAASCTPTPPLCPRETKLGPREPPKTTLLIPAAPQGPGSRLPAPRGSMTGMPGCGTGSRAGTLGQCCPAEPVRPAQSCPSLPATTVGSCSHTSA